MPDDTETADIVTTETSLMYPIPLRQIDSKRTFFPPSSTTVKADGFTTAPLDLSAQEWMLPRNEADPPPTF